MKLGVLPSALSGSRWLVLAFAGVAMPAWATPSVADCQSGDVPGGWPSNACNTHCTLIQPTMISCGATPNSLGISTTDDSEMHVTAAAGAGHDFLVFGSNATYDFCCRIIDNSDELVKLTLQSYDGDDTLTGNAFSTLGQAASTWTNGSGERMPVLHYFGGTWGTASITGSNDSNTTEFLLGGAEVDTLAANNGKAWIRGGGDADVITSGSGDDEIYGDYSNLLGFGSSCWNAPVYAGGADTISSGGGNDVVMGCEGGDTIDASTGDDEIWGFSDTTADCDSTTLDGGDTITGGLGTDQIHGCGGADHIVAGVRTGSSCVTGAGDVDDDIWGEAGADTIRACEGADTVLGGPDNDDISGNAGDDILTGNDGSDSLAGGNDDDVLCDDDPAGGGALGDLYAGGAQNDTIYHGSGSNPRANLDGNLNTDTCTTTGVTVNCEFALTSTPAECVTLGF